MFDVIIIGAGPAGISAALYCKRANLNVLVIHKCGGSLLKAELIENYYGLEAPISGEALLHRGIDQAEKLGIELLEQEVVGVEYNGNFSVKTKSESYETKALIMATGTGRLAPKIAGISEFEGKGVSYCAMCDAFFYRGKNVAVLGSGEYALHEALELKPIVGTVTLVTNGEPTSVELPADMQVNTNKIKSLSGDITLSHINFEDGSSINADGVFVAYGVAGSSQLARVLGAELDGNRIVVNDKMQTSINGLFACGDCAGGLLQIAKAVHEGAVAGIEAVKAVRSQNIKH
ncbi:MAG: NAD(P)/FAD-dependent oxidoreductase [Oscillospiraceae bacterium]